MAFVIRDPGVAIYSLVIALYTDSLFFFLYLPGADKTIYDTGVMRVCKKCVGFEEKFVELLVRMVLRECFAS